MTFDDFRRIHGIGPVVERYLHDAGIQTYAQLAALTPERIVGLVENLPLLSVERIAEYDWPGQARALAQEAAHAPPGAQGAESEAAAGYATFTVDLLLDGHGRVLRTRVAHIQGGEEQSWSGWDADHMLQFLAAHIALKRPDSIADSPSASSTGDAEQPGSSVSTAGVMPTHAAQTTSRSSRPYGTAPAIPTTAPPRLPHGDPILEIGDIIIYEIERADQTSQRHQSQRLRAEIDFRLAGTHGIAAAGKYSVHVIAHELATGQAAVLAVSHGKLTPGELDYVTVLEFPLPDDGRYQLIGVVLLAEAGIVASAPGPVLNVIP